MIEPRRVLVALSLLMCAGGGTAAGRQIRTEILHTPWLGVRLVQDGKPMRLIRHDLRTTEVRLARRPFQFLFPQAAPDIAYQLCAWTGKSVFKQLRPRSAPGSPNAGAQHACFAAGTGMADTEAGSGTLMLSNEGHNYLIGLRLGPDADHPFVHYSTLWTRARGEVPIATAEGNIYLVAFHDVNGDSYLGNSEYDFIILRFGR